MAAINKECKAIFSQKDVEKGWLRSEDDPEDTGQKYVGTKCQCIALPNNDYCINHYIPEWIWPFENDSGIDYTNGIDVVCGDILPNEDNWRSIYQLTASFTHAGFLSSMGETVNFPLRPCVRLKDLPQDVQIAIVPHIKNFAMSYKRMEVSCETRSEDDWGLEATKRLINAMKAGLDYIDSLNIPDSKVDPPQVRRLAADPPQDKRLVLVDPDTLQGTLQAPMFLTWNGIVNNNLEKVKTYTNDSKQLTFDDYITEFKGFMLTMKDYADIKKPKKRGSSIVDTSSITGVGTTVKMLLQAFIMTATEHNAANDTLVKLPLADYMQLRGNKDVKTMRDQVKEDLKAIDSMRISYESAGKKDKDFTNLMITGGYNGIKKGVIFFLFSKAYYSLIESYPVMPLPPEIYRINPQYNPNSYNLIKRILEHKNMNYFEQNANTIGVKTLIESCPDLPKYEDLVVKQVTKRIIDPFTRDMNAISDVMPGFTWTYADKGKIEAPKTYASFLKANIKYTVPNYPERVQTPKKALVKDNKKGGYQVTKRGGIR